MARIRQIKPEFFTSETVAGLSYRARLTWIGLWTHCDDAGRCRDNAQLIRAAVWPLDAITVDEVEDDLRELAAVGRISRYENDGRRYLVIPSFPEHQYIPKATRSKLPSPSDPGSTLYHPTTAPLPEDDGLVPVGLPNHHNRAQVDGMYGKELGVKGSGVKGSRGQVPESQDARAGATLLVPGVQPGATLAASAPGISAIEGLIERHPLAKPAVAQDILRRWYSNGKTLDDLWGALDRLANSGWACTPETLRRELTPQPKPTGPGPASAKAMGWEDAADQVNAARANGVLT
jgi:hypothetical protein